jgi:hypothetical protein
LSGLANIDSVQYFSHNFIGRLNVDLSLVDKRIGLTE